MTLTRTNVSVRHEQLMMAKEQGLNISKILRDALDKALRTDDIKEYEETLKFLEETRDKLDTTIVTIRDKKDEIIKKEREDGERILKRYKNIKEVQDLTPEFLDDSKAMMSLVDVIRQKHPESRASIVEIKKYYDLKRKKK